MITVMGLVQGPLLPDTLGLNGGASDFKPKAFPELQTAFPTQEVVPGPGQRQVQLSPRPFPSHRGACQGYSQGQVSPLTDDREGACGLC